MDMEEARIVAARLADLHESISADIKGFGGILRCSKCSTEQELGNTAHYLRSGWPTCCGLTMTWITQAQIDGEVSR